MAGCELQREPQAVAAARRVERGAQAEPEKTLRKPGKWAGGRGKVTGSGEPRGAKAHTFEGIFWVIR